MKYTINPRITEKAYRTITEQADQPNTYTFTFTKGADKETIKKMVETKYGVTVMDVRTITLPGKARTFKGIVGRTSTVKKALVRLAKGQTIAAFDIDTTNKENQE